MSYVIYNKDTTYYMRGMKSGGYKSKGAATAALNREVAKSKRYTEINKVWELRYIVGHGNPEFKRRDYDTALKMTLEECDIDFTEFCRATNGTVKLLDKADYAVADAIDFHDNIEKMVIRINLMSRKEYEERANTPIYCSPAYESYWSM
jgi:hypothetical protein